MYYKTRKVPKAGNAVRIEYEDDTYTNVSSTYGWRELQKDVESIKKPIKLYMYGQQI